MSWLDGAVAYLTRGARRPGPVRKPDTSALLARNALTYVRIVEATYLPDPESMLGQKGARLKELCESVGAAPGE